MSKYLFVSTLASCVMISSMLCGGDTADECFVKEHVSVGSREMNPRLREVTKQKRADQSEKEEQSSYEETNRVLQKARYHFQSSSSPFKLAPRALVQPKFQQAFYSVNTHWVRDIAPHYRSIQMEDGAFWDVCPSDASTLQYWSIEDDIDITPNTSWLCPYDYYITNKRTKTSVKANLDLGPFTDSEHAHWIIGIDYFAGHIDLQEGSRWCVSPDDNYVLREWAYNDYIIFGHNPSWFSDYTHILINVNLDNFVRAMQY